MWGGEIWEGAEGTESEHRLRSAMNAPQERTFSQPRGKTLYQVTGSRGREGLDVGQTHEANHFHLGSRVYQQDSRLQTTIRATASPGGGGSSWVKGIRLCPMLLFAQHSIL